jgi:hypothetical protein
MSVLIPQDSGRPAAAVRASHVQLASAQLKGWVILGWLGLAYLIMSVIDLALGWYPIRFGQPEWEFGTISATIAGLAIPTLSLYLMLASAFARERTKLIKGIAIAMIVIAVFLAVLFILYLTAVPLALRAVSNNPIIHLGMEKSIIKSLTLFLGYEGLFILGAIKGLRRRVIA